MDPRRTPVPTIQADKAKPEPVKTVQPRTELESGERKAIMELAQGLISAGMALQKLGMNPDMSNTQRVNRSILSAVERRVKLAHKKDLPKLSLKLNRAGLL